MSTASYYGTSYTVAVNSPTIENLLKAAVWGGNVKVQTDSFTATAGDTGDAGSLIYIGKLPANSIPLMVSIHSDGAVTWTGTIGWSGNADALGDFAAFSGAGSQLTGPGYSESYTALTQDTAVYITTATQAIASGDSISTQIFYVNGG